MANYTASPEAVVSFVTQLGLSPSDVSQVSTALANAAAFGSIGLLALSLLFPHLTFWPDSANYTAIQQVNWWVFFLLRSRFQWLMNSTGQREHGSRQR